jgi:hypothetical protein
MREAAARPQSFRKLLRFREKSDLIGNARKCFPEKMIALFQVRVVQGDTPAIPGIGAEL